MLTTVARVGQNSYTDYTGSELDLLWHTEVYKIGLQWPPEPGVGEGKRSLRATEEKVSMEA